MKCAASLPSLLSFLGLALLFATGCSVSADLDGKSCPCAAGWVCDTASDRCVRPDAGRDSATPPSDTGTPPADSAVPPEDVPGRVMFIDDSAATFGMGTLDGTTVDGDALKLDGSGRTGTIESRVFDANGQRAWTSLSWTPRGPYGKNLPDSRGAESGYGADAVDMAGNLMLWHLDEMADLNDGDPVADGSGRSNGGLALAPDSPLRVVDGLIGNAVVDRVDTYLYLPTSTTADFDFGNSDLTWSLWVNTTEDCSDRNKVYLGIDGSASPNAHLWLGCTSVGYSLCPSGSPSGLAGGYFHSASDPRDGGGYCGTTRINDGAWHNLIIVKAGHASARLRLYVDGVMEDERDASFEGPLDFPMDPDLTVGDFTGGTYPAIGDFDEVAIWGRALSASEAGAVYRRGALRLSLQVRACDDPACAGEQFVGPDGTSATSFVDTGTLTPATTATLTGLTGRYVQYRARFDTLSTTASAVLERVAMTGDPI